jgi:hypothetical protein
MENGFTLGAIIVVAWTVGTALRHGRFFSNFSVKHHHISPLGDVTARLSTFPLTYQHLSKPLPKSETNLRQNQKWNSAKIGNTLACPPGTQ